MFSVSGARAAAALCFALWSVCLGLQSPVRAQFICQQFGGSDGGAQAGSNSFACGPGANASGNNGFNTAIGPAADANGQSAANVAIGILANSSGNSGSNTAIGNQSNAQGIGSGNTAIGVLSAAQGDNSHNTATGQQANATGDNSNNTASGYRADANGAGSANVSIGFASNASGTSANNVAIGANTVATGANSVAIGGSASAAFSNSAAFGTGATATRANQQAFGTATNTYTMAGITSAASKAAQSGPTQLVTSDAGGNLATTTLADLGLAGTGDIAAINRQIAGLNSRIDDLSLRTDKAMSGVAMAFAMAGVPTLLPSERFAVTMNYGTFEGANGLALNAAFRLSDNIQFNGGIGYGPDQNIAGGRVGLRMAW